MVIFLRQHNIPMRDEIARQHDFGKIVVALDSLKAIGFVQDGCPTLSCFPLCHELQALTSATNHSY